MNQHSKIIGRLLCIATLISAETNAAATEDDGADSLPASCAFEEWSACILPPKSVAIGTILESGTGYDTMLSADPAALSLGMRTAQVKWKLPILGDDMFALGFKYVSFSRRTLFSETIRQQFDTLDGHFYRPSIVWTSRMSPRLLLHTFWATGFGKTHAVLSDYGKRELWKSKHGNDPYPGDAPTSPGSSTSSTANQVKSSSDESATFARRTMQVQSIAGLTDTRFQITGEFQRENGNQVFLATRFERTHLEDLETFSVRVTVAEQWTLDQFRLRIGGGPQYSMLSGKDLDGEEIKSAGLLPAGDIAFYWCF